MDKPRLTSKVMRGLMVLIGGSAAIEVIEGTAEFEEHEGALTRDELSDAKRAHDWITDMNHWRGSR